MIYKLLTALIIILQFADAATTFHLIKGGGRELNPIMNWLFQKVGLVTGLSLKVIVVSGVSIMFLYVEPLVLIPTAIIYFCVVGWNLYQVVKNNGSAYR